MYYRHREFNCCGYVTRCPVLICSINGCWSQPYEFCVCVCIVVSILITAACVFNSTSLIYFFCESQVYVDIIQLNLSDTLVHNKGVYAICGCALVLMV